MLARLGFMIYSLGWLVALPVFALMFWGMVNQTLDWAGQVVLGIFAGLVLLSGRIICYVLSGS